MRNYIIFIISFLILFLLLFYVGQFFYGMFLIPTSIADTNINEIWQEMINSMVAKSSSPFWIIMLTAFVAATIAHFISKKLQNINH